MSDDITLVIQPRAPVEDIVLVLEEAGHSAEYYSGEYEVTPSWQEQILATEAKTMREDVTVHSIPVEITINQSGGNTVTIGG